MSCSKQAPQAAERLGILPVENLSGDPALDSLSFAIQYVLVDQLAGSSKVQPYAVATVPHAYASRPERLVHGYLTGGDSRQLRLALTIEDFSTHKMVAAPVATAAPGRELAMIDSAARRLAPEVRPFGTDSAKAFRAYADGLKSSDLPALERAIAADRDFGPAYLAAIRILTARGEIDQARSFVRRGLARGSAVAPAERAQLDLFRASFENDPAARSRAAIELARAMPADPAAALGAAQLATAAVDFRSAVEWYGRAVKLDPTNAGLWNELGYAEAYNGNLDGARSALLEYGRRTPKNPNGFDSLGEVHYMFGDFAAAEKYFLEAARMDASFIGGAAIWKAAHARLMTGDIAGADGIMNGYFDLLRKKSDPLLDYRRAAWDHLAGRRSEAMARKSTGPAASLLHAQRAVWMLEASDVAGAREEVKQAFATARSPQAKSLAAVVAFTSQPPPVSPQVAEDPARRLATAYALLFARRFADAVPLLTAAAKTTPPPGNDSVKVMLAWALIESGRALEAAPYLSTYPLPQPGVDVFSSLAVPRVFRLQAGVLEKQGKSAEAERKREIFRKLGG